MKQPPQPAEIINVLMSSLTSITGITDITEESLLINDIGVDSIRIAELSIDLEERLGMPVFLPDLFAVQNPYEITVKSASVFIAEKVNL
jgi:acyl carrier protein